MNHTIFTATRRAKGAKGTKTATLAMMAQDRLQQQHARHLVTNLFIAEPLQSASAGGGR